MKTNEYITTTAVQTKKLGGLLAEELRGGEIICLSGDLGAGKTTFTQGLLQGLGISGPYTSPTFAIIKEYKLATDNPQLTTRKRSPKLSAVYHIDAYRVSADDLVGLGWQDFAGQSDTVVIIEWAERARRIIPNPPAGGALWLDFEWLDEKRRKITISQKK